MEVIDFRELVDKIHQTTEEFDLVLARKYIEENIKWLSENKHYLKGNARALLDFLLIGNYVQPLNKVEMNIVRSINSYASKFDLRGLRIAVKNNAELLLREDVKYYLNNDAKFLLEGMNAIHKEA